MAGIEFPGILCTNSFNIQKFCVLPTMHLCVLYGSQNKQRLFLYTALINLSVFKTEAESAYCEVGNGSLNQTDTVSYLKGQLPCHITSKSMNVCVCVFSYF